MSKDPKREFFYNLGQLIFWSIVFGIILVTPWIIQEILQFFTETVYFPDRI